MATIHPVVDQQLAMNGGGGEAFQASPEGFMVDLPGEAFDLRVSRFVGGLVLGAALSIFALRLAGFRFSFGASVGGGG